MTDTNPAPQPHPTIPSLQRPSLSTRAAAWWARLGRSLLRGMGPGAILDKELRIQGRRVGTYWIRLGYGLVMAVFVGLTLANVFTQALASGQTATLATIESLQRSGPIVLLALAWTQFIGTSLAAAVFTSPLVCEERRAGTLATLLTTPLTAWQVVVGKASGALVQLMILGLMGLPVLLAIRVFGGISGELVIYTIFILAGATIGCCALGVLASTLSLRQSGAISLAILLTLVWYAGPPLIGAALQSAGIPAPWTSLLMFSPGAGMVGLVARLEGQSLFGPTPLPFWAMNFLASLAIATLAFLTATFRLRAIMRQVGAGRERPARARRKSAAISNPDQPADAPDSEIPNANTPPLTPRQQRKANQLANRRARMSRAAAARTGSRTVSDHPILWRELRQPMTSRRWLTWFGAIAITTLIAWAFWVARDGETVAGFVAVLGLVASIVIISGTAGSALGQERESRSWETLLSTPISITQILLGKLVGVLVRLRLIWILILATLLIACIGSGLRAAVIVHVAILLLSTSFFVAALGLFFGTITKRSMVAIMATMGSLLCIWLIIPVAGLMCAGLTMRGNETLASVVGVTNPVAWAVLAIDGARSSRWTSSYSLFSFGSLNAFEFTLVLSIFASVYIAMGLALLAMARSAMAMATLRTHISPPLTSHPGFIAG